MHYGTHELPLFFSGLVVGDGLHDGKRLVRGW